MPIILIQSVVCKLTQNPTLENRFHKKILLKEFRIEQGGQIDNEVVLAIEKQGD